MQQPDQRCAQQVQHWHQFTSKQLQRYVPAPTGPALHLLSESTCYRLRVMAVSGLPLLSPPSETFCQVQLGVSLYNEALGTFYGNTCYSQPDMPQQQEEAEPGAGVAMQCCFDIFFHSCIADPRCMAVVSCRTKSLSFASVTSAVQQGHPLGTNRRLMGVVHTGIRQAINSHQTEQEIAMKTSASLAHKQRV
jgi:hypothetical protein